MRSQLVKADASGAFRVNASGSGFRIVPTLPGAAEPQFAVGNLPGQLPVRVRPNGDGDYLHVPNTDALFPAERFALLDVDGAEPSSWYCVQTFELREGVVPAGTRTRRAIRLQPAGTAVSLAAPALATEGVPVRPGFQSLTWYATGGVSCRVYVRTLAGNWVDTGVDLDFATEAVQTRFVDQPADRIALKASGGAMTAEVDASVEVG